MSTITPLPTPPSRSRPTQFSAETDAFLSALATFGTEVNVVAGEINDDATTASNAAVTSTTQAEIATQKALEALGSADVAAASASATVWVSGATVAQWAVVISPTSGQSYRRITATGSGTTDPEDDPTNYVAITTDQKMERSYRTTNVKLVRSDIGKLIDIEGSFDQTFDPCSNLGSGWWCIYRNISQVYTLSLNPDGSELIDGMATFNIYPLETRLIQCDGSTLRSIVITPFFFTSGESITFYKPPGYRAFHVEAWGAGGGGGKQPSNSYNVVGGGGGGYGTFIHPSYAIGDSTAIIVGAGGSAATTNGQAGGWGGSTTIWGYTVTGGGGGDDSTSNIGASGGAMSDYVYTMNSTETTGGSSTNQSNGTLRLWGAGSGGSIRLTTDTICTPGTSTYGGNGGVANITTSGQDGYAPGGGGGATRTGAQSGAGGRGEVRIRGIL